MTKTRRKKKRWQQVLLLFLPSFDSLSHGPALPMRSEFADFLNQMLVLDPQHRLSAGDALKHAFLNDS
jgi:serine/threonine protein kinase